MIGKNEWATLEKTNFEDMEARIMEFLGKDCKTYYHENYQDFTGTEIYASVKGYEQADGTYVVVAIEGSEGFLKKREKIHIGYFKVPPMKLNKAICMPFLRSVFTPANKYIVKAL